MGKKINRITIVAPVFNEEKYLDNFIKKLLKEVKKIPVIKKIIFINDGSWDGSRKILERYEKNSIIKIITNRKNQGKGAALRLGFAEAKKEDCDAVIFIDSDQQHDPSYLPLFVKNLSRFPLVFGCRNLARDSPWIRKIGNHIARFIIRKLFHIERKDILCGLMAMRSDVFESLSWRSDDYGVETEISTIVGKAKLRFKEVTIKNIYLDKRKGVNLFHAFLILLRIPFWYFSFTSEKELFRRFLTGIIFILICLYFSLAFKNPFGIRSLIPNLEPYPDSLYYATPAWNFVKGVGFNMSFDRYKVISVTPPLYSLYLIPFLAIFADVRSFYLANMVLMIASIILFVLILKKIFKENLLSLLTTLLLGFALITNFYFYTLPSLLMAENITVFILLLAVYLLLLEVSTVAVIIAGFLGTMLWLIKFSNLPLGLVFYLFYSLKVIRNKGLGRLKLLYFLCFSAAGLGFVSYLMGSKILIGHKNLQPGTSFSMVYFLENLTFYLRSLSGGETRYLWFQEKMMGFFWGALSFAGLIYGLMEPKFRNLVLIFYFFFDRFYVFFLCKRPSFYHRSFAAVDFFHRFYFIRLISINKHQGSFFLRFVFSFTLSFTASVWSERQ